LKHEIFLFSSQVIAISINLARNGQIFYENQAHKANVSKMGKYFTTIVGQSDWSRHCYWLSCLTYDQPVVVRVFGGLSSPKQYTKLPQIEKRKL